MPFPKEYKRSSDTAYPIRWLAKNPNPRSGSGCGNATTVDQRSERKSYSVRASRLTLWSISDGSLLQLCKLLGLLTRNWRRYGAAIGTVTYSIMLTGASSRRLRTWDMWGPAFNLSADDHHHLAIRPKPPPSFLCLTFSLSSVSLCALISFRQPHAGRASIAGYFWCERSLCTSYCYPKLWTNNGVIT